jgi:hypothetical protein
VPFFCTNGVYTRLELLATFRSGVIRHRRGVASVVIPTLPLEGSGQKRESTPISYGGPPHDRRILHNDRRKGCPCHPNDTAASLETGIVRGARPFIIFKNEAIFRCNSKNLNEFIMVASFCPIVAYLVDSMSLISMASFGFAPAHLGGLGVPGVGIKRLILNTLTRNATAQRGQDALAVELFSGMENLFRPGSGRVAAPVKWLRVGQSKSPGPDQGAVYHMLTSLSSKFLRRLGWCLVWKMRLL